MQFAPFRKSAAKFLRDRKVRQVCIEGKNTRKHAYNKHHGYNNIIKLFRYNFTKYCHREKVQFIYHATQLIDKKGALNSASFACRNLDQVCELQSPVIARRCSTKLPSKVFEIEIAAPTTDPSPISKLALTSLTPRVHGNSRAEWIYFSRIRPDNVAGLFTSYEDSRWKPVIKLTEISRRIGGPIKSGRKSKTMADRDIKGRRRAGRRVLSKFLQFDVFGVWANRKPFLVPFCHAERYSHVLLSDFPSIFLMRSILIDLMSTIYIRQLKIITHWIFTNLYILDIELI